MNVPVLKCFFPLQTEEGCRSCAQAAPHGVCLSDCRVNRIFIPRTSGAEIIASGFSNVAFSHVLNDQRNRTITVVWEVVRYTLVNVDCLVKPQKVKIIK